MLDSVYHNRHRKSAKVQSAAECSRRVCHKVPLTSIKLCNSYNITEPHSSQLQKPTAFCGTESQR